MGFPACRGEGNGNVSKGKKHFKCLSFYLIHNSLLITSLMFPFEIISIGSSGKTARQHSQNCGYFQQAEKNQISHIQVDRREMFDQVVTFRQLYFQQRVLLFVSSSVYRMSLLWSGRHRSLNPDSQPSDRELCQTMCSQKSQRAVNEAGDGHLGCCSFALYLK